MSQQPYYQQPQPQAQYAPPSPPGPDYLAAYGQPERRRERRSVQRWLIPLGTFLLGAFLGALIMAPSASRTATPAPTVTEVGPAASAPAVTPARALTPADIKLTVRETSKECFGSYGCNVKFQISAATDLSLIGPGDSYEVTYSVKGLKEDMTQSLTLKDDGTFDQDSFQFGTKPRSGTKLTAVVTHVQRLL